MTDTGTCGFSGVGLTTGPTTDPYSLDKMLARVADAGAQAAQVYAAEWDVVIGGRVCEPRLRRYRAVVQRYQLGLTLHAPIDHLDLFDPDETFQVEQFRAWIAVAHTLGCTTLTYHPGRYVPARQGGASLCDLLRRERAALARLAEEAAAADVTIACENLHDEPWWPNGEVAYSAEPLSLLATVEAVHDPHVGVCLDFGHLYLTSVARGFDFVASVQALAPHAVVLHVHDNLGKPRRRPLDGGLAAQIIRGEGDLHLPIGWGIVPLAEAFGGASFARRPLFIAEVHERYWRHDRATAVETIANAHSLMDLATNRTRTEHRVAVAGAEEEWGRVAVA